MVVVYAFNPCPRGGRGRQISAFQTTLVNRETLPLKIKNSEDTTGEELGSRVYSAMNEFFT
jgi:hypothetical protein